MLRADRWGRLREGVRRCQLRRGAWYPVLRVGTDAAVVVVRHQSVIVPPSYLEIVDARPSKWTLIARSEEHTSELQSLTNLVCRLLLEKKNKRTQTPNTQQES